ncbi:hypothetical protein T484DRAFT_1856188 [Baffinella frigidus]|nr:hypothetical protein T484DRAFT_1856188 [Cryptophyta sp. CCMP2293]
MLPAPPPDPLPALQNLQLFTFFRRVSLNGVAPRDLSGTLSSIFQGMLFTMAFRLRAQGACLLCGVRAQMSLPDDNQMQLGVTAIALCKPETPMLGPSPGSPRFAFQRVLPETSEIPLERFGGGAGKSASQSTDSRPTRDDAEASGAGGHAGGGGAEGGDDGRSCRVIKVNEEGNISVWTSRLLLEGQAMCRAQAAAIGGNAVLHYNVDQMIVNNMAHKMRVYSVLMVTGDAVRIQPHVRAQDVP